MNVSKENGKYVTISIGENTRRIPRTRGYVAINYGHKQLTPDILKLITALMNAGQPVYVGTTPEEVHQQKPVFGPLEIFGNGHLSTGMAPEINSRKNGHGEIQSFPQSATIFNNPAKS